jgi:hypothetical protein
MGSPMTMLDNVADVENVATVAKPARSSPDMRAALQYLDASGARADLDHLRRWRRRIAVGFKPDAVAGFWLSADKARAVAARARKLAGDAADVESVVAAVQAAAVQLQVRLTEHDTAMARAAKAAERLDRFLDHLKVSGIWLEFTKTYRQRRLAAKARGDGFMPFSAAELRFKRALIPLLQNGGQPVLGASLFATIFDS